jgi:hypothetical protein
MQDKELTVIIYKPGYGGHFISSILSLHGSTYCPYMLKDNENASRKEIFTFRNLQTKYGNWKNHHDTRPVTVLKTYHIRNFYKDSNYKSWIVSFHPIEYYNYFVQQPIFKIQTKMKKVNFLHIHLSSNLEHVIDKFKLNNNNFPVLGDGENELDEKFIKENNPFVINFDNFILGEKTFIAEYEKICNHLRLPIQLEDALELYRDWYVERKFTEFLQ